MTNPPRDQQSAGRRTQVLRLLREATEPLGITEIAERLGIHANTARFHLETLADNGQVERTSAEPGRPGRPPQRFLAVRGMEPMGPRHYRVLAEVLTATLASEPDPSRRATEAGRHWGRREASTVTGRASSGGPGRGAADGRSVDLLVGMLDTLGFEPERNDDGIRSQIGLRNCPFLELAVHHSDIVCPVHLGLMRGALESWDSPLTVDRLDAFVEPGLCMAHLSAVGAPQSRAARDARVDPCPAPGT